MRPWLILLILCLWFDPIDSSDQKSRDNTWAVLIAGAKDWPNYAAQSSVSHAYHTLINHGVNPDKMIVFMYDDVANDPENPYPGKLFTEVNGTDVYAGVKIDYKGEDLNAETIMNVLKGNTTGVQGLGTERVLKSTSTDHVFIYHIGHGNLGVIGMPDSYPITKKELNGTLQYMYDNKMYKKLLFYLETCFSGSMFEGLDPKYNIFAITAAAPNQYAAMAECNMGPFKPICIGSEFAHAWMSNTESNNILTETVGQQVDTVTSHVYNSTVCQYGDRSERNETVSDYQGKTPVSMSRLAIHRMPKKSSTIKASDAEMIYQLKQMEQQGYSEKEIEDQKKIFKVKREELTNFVREISKSVLVDDTVTQHVMTVIPTITQLDCHHEVIHAFSQLCAPFSSNPFARQLSHVFANLCEINPDYQQIVDHLETKCKNGPLFYNVL